MRPGANRALELLGKELGMFREKAAKSPMNELAAVYLWIQEKTAERSLLPSGE
ncbi:MAG: hypothetical protein U5K56_09940 [Halioglobus sp.]|nr:hypothetical protein [Halioglobus sp.]